MHELSLAQNIIESIAESVGEDRLSLVERVLVEIGAGSGVVADALLFAFDSIVPGTNLSSARLRADIIPFVVRCSACGRDSASETGLMICRHCGSADTAVVSGTELILKEIELRDE